MKAEISEDIAGKSYWDNTWKDSKIPDIINPQNHAPGNVTERALNDFFVKIFSQYMSKTEDKLFLEVGCGNSAFLPYMSKEFGFKVSGLDYSEVGCEMAKRVAAHYGVQAEILLCDLFEPKKEMQEKYDVVFAAGVIEHFKETSRPCKAMSELLKKDGIIVNIVPNFSYGSFVGKLQKKYAFDIYDKHIPLDKNDLIQAHEIAGIKTLYCEYLLAYNYGVINFNGRHEVIRKYYVRKGKLQMIFKRNRIMGRKKYAPYIVYVGKKM